MIFAIRTISRTHLFEMLGQVAAGAVLALAMQSISAQTVYKCQVGGEVVYQDSPCKVRSGRNAEYYFEPAPVKVAQKAGEKAAPVQTTPGQPMFKKHPKSPTITFYHDPDGMTRSWPMAAIIQRAAALWNARCNVNFVYGGERRGGSQEGRRQSPETGYYVRWSNVMSSGNGGVGGEASPTSGVALSGINLANEAAVLTILTHEMGHVIYMAHLHEDKKSIMSYWRMTPQTTDAVTLSDSDYLNCNIAMRDKFGVPFEMPAGAVVRDARQMSDEEAAAVASIRR